MLTPISQVHFTDGALALVAAVIGVVVARAAVTVAQRSEPRTRLLFVLSVINLSLLILVWALPRALGTHSPVATALTGPPMVFYVLPAMALLAASLTRSNRQLLPMNVCVLCGALWAVMGFRFAVLAPPDPHEPFKMLSWNVGESPQDLHAVVMAIRMERPDIVCLLDSAPSGDPGAVSDHLEDYHWFRKGDLAIGSLGLLSDRRLLTLDPDSGHAQALIAMTHVAGIDVTVAAADMLPGVVPPGDAAEAADNLKQTLKDAHKPVVVAASLGAQPASPPWQVLSLDLPDAFESSGDGFGYTSPAAFPVRRTDYIFASPDLVVKSADVESDPGGDDLPVTATMGMPPPIHTVASADATP